MYIDTINKFAEASVIKAGFLKENFIKFFLSSVLAGVYVGFGIVLIFSIGAPFSSVNSPAVKILMGVSFGIALTLVIIAGAELFTGNNMIMIIGKAAGKTTFADLSLIWAVSYLGNLSGSLLLALLVTGSGIFVSPVYVEFIGNIVSAKMNLGVFELIFRGILCNMLVCLAVWMSMRVKGDSAKVLVIFWCLFAFISSGFEHSVANMTLLAIPLLANHNLSINWGGYFYNLTFVTLGNIIGGIFIGLIYSFLSIKKTGGKL